MIDYDDQDPGHLGRVSPGPSHYSVRPNIRHREPGSGQHETDSTANTSFRVRTVGELADGDVVFRIDYIETTEPPRDGEALIGITVRQGDAEIAFMTGAEEALLLSNRLTRAANLVMP